MSIIIQFDIYGFLYLKFRNVIHSSLFHSKQVAVRYGDPISENDTQFATSNSAEQRCASSSFCHHLFHIPHRISHRCRSFGGGHCVQQIRWKAFIIFSHWMCECSITINGGTWFAAGKDASRNRLCTLIYTYVHTYANV